MDVLEEKMPPVLYSVGTEIAWFVNKNFYNNKHYCWCAPWYNNTSQPVTSNPKDICKRYMDIISTRDIHALEITNNHAGIIKGAKLKSENGDIDIRIKDVIITLMELKKNSENYYEEFMPVIYIIPTYKVYDRIERVSPNEAASKTSIEYRIKDLSEGEFEAIHLQDVIRR